jgi:Ca2+-binding RTX toxin-like protein
MALLAGGRAYAACAALIALLAAAPAAYGAQASAVEVPSPFGEPNEGVTFSEFHYQAGTGELNSVELHTDTAIVRLADGGALVDAGSNCKSLAPNAVECYVPTCAFQPCFKFPYLVAVIADLGDGDDRLAPAAPRPCAITCPIDRAEAALRVKGGPGNDTLRGGSGGPDFYDDLSGGPGNDTIVQGDGNLTVSCGPGYDTVVVDPNTPVPADCERVLRRAT